MNFARAFHRNLTVQVLVAIALGATIGHVRPAWGVALGPLGDGFIRLIRMVVGPIVFLTIVGGIAGMGDLRKVGRIGLKALIYFEGATTLALALGLIVANVVRPGDGVVPVASTTDRQKADEFAQRGKSSGQSLADLVLHAIPENVVGAFAAGDLLQILTFAVLFGSAAAALGLKDSPLIHQFETLTAILFRVVAIITTVAPLGAFGAMAFTVGKFGLHSLVPLAKLMGCVYLTMAGFIFGVLGIACRVFGFRLLPYLSYIRQEVLLVLGTSSSESALPRMIRRCEELGADRAVVEMVIPAGYSFNLDGTSIYLSMAVLFIAQALRVPLTLGEQVGALLILMLTSKGAAGVTGAGFVTLAATLAATRVVPVEGLALLIGVDRFMSEARAITNVIGNGVAALCVARWEGAFDSQKFAHAVRVGPEGSLDKPRPAPVDLAELA